MQITLTQSNNERRLILIFAGWSIDSRPLERLRHSSYDIAVAWDYRSLDSTHSTLLDAYDEICVIAWSFGVAAANAFLLKNPELPVTARIAVNGTLYPVDNQRGIPVTIFEGTLNGLSDATLTKFQRRMCGSSEAFRQFKETAPQHTDIANLAEELRAIRQLPLPDTADKKLWDAVYITDADRIIPTQNQQEAWRGHPHITIMSGAHLPDFQKILRQSIKDKQLIANRFGNSAETYDSAADCQRQIAASLMDLLTTHTDLASNPATLEAGCGTGLLTNLIQDRLNPSKLNLWDIAPIAPELPGDHLQCDAETQIASLPGQSLDLIISASTIQWFNSPTAFIRHCRGVLRSGGVLAISTFGRDNFKELRPFLPATPTYLDLTAWHHILQTAGFDPLIVTEEHLAKNFADVRTMLSHIRSTGVNAISSIGATSSLRTLLAVGPTTLTYHPVYLIGRKM